VLALPAQADTTAHIAPSFSPDRLGAGTAFTLAIKFTSELGVPSPVRKAIVHLPAGLGINLRGIGTCSKTRLAARGPRACPPSSLVGSGSAVLAGQLGLRVYKENATLTAFRGPNQGGHPTLEISGQGLTPLDLRVTFTGVLLADNAPYGQQLVMSIPAVPTIPLEPNAATTRFSLTIGGGKGASAHARGAIRVPHACPAEGFPFAANFTFEDGSSGEASTALSCP
jgi:hypothetical protein